jgi:pimeloyl-ACP methyl ester carboxylesterase
MSGDQLAVLDAAGVEGATVAGAGIGANYALRLACHAPKRVRAILAVGPLARVGERPPAGYRLFEETWRVMRADGLEAVFRAAGENPRFDDAPAGGPYAARFAADEDFVEDTRRKGRERYVSRVVRFRDGMFPPDRTFFSVEDSELAACKTPVHIAPGTRDLFPASAAEALVSLAPAARTIATPRSVDDWLRAIETLEAE